MRERKNKEATAWCGVRQQRLDIFSLLLTTLHYYSTLLLNYLLPFTTPLYYFADFDRVAALRGQGDKAGQ